MSAGISNETIAEALQRAKQLAATVREDTPGKRPAEDDADNEYNPAKRSANGVDMAGNPIATLGFSGVPASMPNLGEAVIVDNFEVPDACVGLVIGRGGENISNIQAQTGCRVQMAPDSGGRNMRPVTLQGSRSSIEKAKGMIQSVIDRSGGRPPPSKGVPGLGGMMGGMGMASAASGQMTKEMIIPGSKCGLIIGKGGETIKQIQEKAGVKIILIQESQSAGNAPKPLRIMGDPDKVEYAKSLIEEIMNSKDDLPPHQRGGGDRGGGYGGGHHHNDYGGGARSIGEVIVPRSSVGLIIGKGGEMIRKLSMESGAKIQFKQDEDQNGPERTAIIQGTPDQIQRATHMISDLVNKEQSERVYMFKSGEGSSDVFYMHIPAMKTGLVIGRGGETIKQICAESGAHVELSRDAPPSPTEKVFIIKGTPYQIHHAQHIIRIKVGDLAPGTPVPPFQGPGGPQQGVDQNFGGGFPNAGNFQQPQQWGGYQQQADPNAQAWSNYYQQQQQYGNFYGQGAPQQAAAPQQMQPQPQQQANAGGGAPAINPQTGQPDYSAQWAEYYRSLGMHDQAAMIEQQAKANQQQGAQPAAQPAGAQPAYTAGYGQQQAGPYAGGYGAPAGGQPQPQYQY